MVGWIVGRIRDVLREETAKHAKAPKAPKKTWRDYRGGDDPSLLQRLGRWPDEQALLTILTCAVTADRETDPKESAALDAIIFRSPTFRRLSRNALDALVVAVGKEMAKDRTAALEKATRTFMVSKDRQGSAYMHAADILHADQNLMPSEEEFARDLAAMLGIADPAPFDTLMKQKNWKGLVMDSDQRIEEKHKAFFTILAAAVLIDGEETKDEREELNALMTRARLLSHFELAARDTLREPIVKNLKSNFSQESTRFDRVSSACDSLLALESSMPGICLSAYIHAIDLAHADRDLRPSEVRYLDYLESKFGSALTGTALATLSTPAAARELIKQKNKY
jgi:uncharacterized tellurite resistance protein B-like protein